MTSPAKAAVSSSERQAGPALPAPLPGSGTSGASLRRWRERRREAARNPPEAAARKAPGRIRLDRAVSLPFLQQLPPQGGEEAAVACDCFGQKPGIPEDMGGLAVQAIPLRIRAVQAQQLPDFFQGGKILPALHRQEGIVFQKELLPQGAE